jgi:transposase
MTTTANALEVILGVDTHLDTHVGVVVDGLGRVLGTLSIPTTADGYQQLWAWAKNFGPLHRAGVEGTGSYGAGLACYLTAQGLRVLEVNRPDRSKRRRRGKSDPTDAENAARAVLAGEACALPKSHAGMVESMRAILVARRSAMKARTQAINQLRGLLVSAPQALREAVLKRKTEECIRHCAQLDAGAAPSQQVGLYRALRLLAERWQYLSEELQQLDQLLEQLVKATAPQLVKHYGVGFYCAATLLVAAGDNPERMHSEAAFAALCGASPLEASSGKVKRHRLNRGGDRQANNALWIITMARMRSEERSKAYVERRTQEGRSYREIQRCLKRYITRELYPLILSSLAGGTEAA